MNLMLAVGGDTIQRPRRVDRVGRAVAAVLGLALLLVPVVSDPAAAQEASLAATTRQVLPPGQINVRGTQFPAGELIEIRFGADSSPVLTTVTADASGAFSAEAPSASLSPGEIEIQACACESTPTVRVTTSLRVLGYAQATIGAPSSASVGDTVTLDGSNAVDPDGEVVAWDWIITNQATGNRITARGAIAEVTLADPGLHDVVLLLTDSDSLISGDETQINVTEVVQVPPVAVADVPASATVGSVVRMASSNSTDSDGSITARQWEFGDGNSSRAANPNHSWASPGTYTVSLRVTDNDQISDISTRRITISAVATTNPPPTNQRPSANAGRSITAEVDSEVVFDGRDSIDSDGSVTNWSWNFGDGNLGDGPRPRHIYRSAGTFTATLQVTDDEGAADTDTVRVTVTAAPVVEPPPPPQTTGAPAGTASPQTTAEPGPEPPPTAPDGGSLPSTTLPGSEVATINLGGPYEVDVGETLQISGPDDLDSDDISNWTWSFSDGRSPTTSNNLSRNYANPGRFTIDLAVTTEGGATGFGTATVTVRQVDLGDGTPIPDIGGPYTAIEGEPVLLDASRSSDLDGEIVNWEWNVGLDSLLIGEVIEHTFDADGTYPIILRVTDDTGATAITVTTVEVFGVECALDPSLVNDFRGQPRTATTSEALTTFRLVVETDCAGLQVGFAVNGEVIINRVAIGPAGLAEASIRMPDGLTPGEHELTAVFGDEQVVLAETTWELASVDGVECDLNSDEVTDLEARPSGNGIRVSVTVNRERVCPVRPVTLRVTDGPSTISPEPFTIDGQRSSRLMSAPRGVEPGVYQIEIMAGGEVLAATSLEVTEGEGNQLNLIAILGAGAITVALLAVAVPIFLRRF